MFFTAIKAFFDTFGAIVFVPVVIFIIALVLKVPPKKAFMSGLSAGVGLEGFNLVIGAYSPIITPVINQLVKDTGIKLNILDMGWQTTSIIAYSTNVGMIFIAIAIILQTVLFLTRYTNVFQAGDLWNNYSYMAWGSILYLLTKNMWLSMACMVIQLLYTLCFTEVIEKRWSEYYHYPNCTIASLHTATVGVYAILMNWLLNRLGLYKVKADPDAFRKRFGFLGEPMTLGLLLGAPSLYAALQQLPLWPCSRRFLLSSPVPSDRSQKLPRSPSRAQKANGTWLLTMPAATAKLPH